jgi:hypothetical protein
MKQPCQAIVVRYVPDPVSGETLNVGVVLLSPGHGFMGARFLKNWTRVHRAFPEADRNHLRRIVSAIQHTCETHYATQLPLQASSNEITAIFDRVLPADDASLVRSTPISGITADPSQTLRELFDRYVAAHELTDQQRNRRSDSDVWATVSALLKARKVLDRMRPYTVHGRHEERFDHAWRNGHWNVAKPLSLDLVDPHEITRKAASWSGRILALHPQEQVAFHLVIGTPPNDAPADVRAAASDGIDILREQLEPKRVAEIVREEEADAFVERVAQDLLRHDAGTR